MKGLLIHIAGSAGDAPEWTVCEDCLTYWRENSWAVLHAAASVGIEHGLTTNAAIDGYFAERHGAHTDTELEVAS